MTQDEIIEMAQECGLVGMRPHLDGIYVKSLVAFAKLVAEKALAQPEQEPVISKWVLREVYFDEDGEPIMHRSTPQRTWVGLTDEDMADITSLPIGTCSMMLKVEAKLKEKNNA